jgi:secreted PhoX family phosphatase
VYLTEDLIDGAFYRFTPKRPRDLSEGLLEVALVGRDRSVRWRRVHDPAGRARDTRDQVSGATRFKRAEGIWFDEGVVYLSTTGDSRVHAYDTRARKIEVIYDGLGKGDTPLLRVDQLTASKAGEVFVCEDLATSEIDIGVIEPDRRVSRFLSVTGPAHRGSELTGVCFDPSGTRMYFSSQRARKHGVIYEVSGPFRTKRA